MDLKGSVYITPKDIQILSGCQINAARREHLAIRDAIGRKFNKLTVYEYCEYWGVNPEHIIRHLNQYR